MKISIDPMPQLRAQAESDINGWFNQAAMENAQKDAEHQIKQQMARRIITNVDPVPAAFAAAAAIEGLTPAALAALIVEKDADEVMARANERRRLIVAVRRATTPAALEAIVAQAGGDQVGGPAR
jgi:hypothetical protein